MRSKYLGNTKEKIPEVGIGTWKMGENPEKEIDAIRAGIRKGMRFIDTAEMYGTEWVVAKAIRDAEEVFVATKVSPSHFSYNDVIKACDRSLNNLGVKQIDLYQLHWPNHSVPIRETMRAMEALVDAGKIRHIGVSNFTIKEFQAAQDSMAKYEIVSNQVEYSILVDLEPGLLDFCNKRKITIIAYSPLAKGAIFYPKNRDVLSVLEAIGKRHNKSAVQVALNWIVSKKGVVAIPKASDVAHLLENAGASGWRLTQKEYKILDSMCGNQQPLLAGRYQSILKSSGIWARAAHSMYAKKAKHHLKSSTTKSSKK